MSNSDNEDVFQIIWDYRNCKGKKKKKVYKTVKSVDPITIKTRKMMADQNKNDEETPKSGQQLLRKYQQQQHIKQAKCNNKKHPKSNQTPQHSMPTYQQAENYSQQQLLNRHLTQQILEDQNSSYLQLSQHSHLGVKAQNIFQAEFDINNFLTLNDNNFSERDLLNLQEL